MMRWEAQPSGTAWVVALHNEQGQTIKVHPIPFALEREAERAAVRLNERDDRIGLEGWRADPHYDNGGSPQ